MRSAMRTVLKRWLIRIAIWPSVSSRKRWKISYSLLGVQRRSRLVEHQHLGIAHEGAAKRDLLPLRRPTDRGRRSNQWPSMVS